MSGNAGRVGPGSLIATASAERQHNLKLGERFQLAGGIDVEIIDVGIEGVKLALCISENARCESPDSIAVRVNGSGYYRSDSRGPKLIANAPRGKRIQINDQIELIVQRTFGANATLIERSLEQVPQSA